MYYRVRNYRNENDYDNYDVFDEDYGDFGDDYMDLPEPLPLQRTLTDPVTRL